MQRPWSHGSCNAPTRRRASNATTIAGLALLFAFAFAHAQPQETQDDLAIDKSMRASVIDAVARYTENNYVFVDRAKEIARALRRHEKTETTTTSRPGTRSRSG